MTDSERIAALEARVAELEARVLKALKALAELYGLDPPETPDRNSLQ